VNPAPDLDEALSTRLRDLALVELDALVAGDRPALIGAYADDVADALREARTRIAALRAQLGGADPLGVLDAAGRQRAADGGAGADRIRVRLAAHAEAARALARLADLASALVPKLFEADRRR
jgi:hypothetical protein